MGSVIFFISSLFLETHINEIIQGITAGTYEKKDDEDDEIYEGKLSFRHHSIVYVKEGNSHRDNHRKGHYPVQKPRYQKERAAEFTEYRHHKGGVASETENTRISIDQRIEINHFVQTVRKEEYAKDDTDN